MLRFCTACLVLVSFVANAQTHDASFAPLITGPSVVYASIKQPNDKLILAGAITALGTAAIPGGMVRLNADGTIDNSFNVGTGPDVRVHALALQADGKILVGGSFTKFNGQPANRILRLNSDGTVDNTFAVSTSISNNPLEANPVEAIAVQADNKIILLGAFTAFNGQTAKSIVRLNADGTKDNSFTPPPIEFLGPGWGDGRFALRIQPDGKILAGSYFTHVGGVEKKYLVRLNADGTLDNAFMTNLGTGFDSHVTSIDLQSDGKIIVGGRFTRVNSVTPNRNQVVRLNADGTLEATFHADAGFNNGNSVQSVRVTTGDKILVAGNFQSSEKRIIRLNSNGTPDVGFDPGTGFENTTTGFSDVKETFFQNDGSILTVGNFNLYNGATRINVARLGDTGGLDATYAPNPSGPASVYKAVVLSSGKILLCGNFLFVNGSYRPGIARLLSTGALDNAFNLTGVSFVGGSIETFGVLSSQKILVGGTMTYTDGITKAGLLRLHEDGSFDNTFTGFTGMTRQFSTDGVYAIEALADDKVLIGGGFQTFNGLAKVNLAKLNADGSIDPTFHVAGNEFANRIVKIVSRPSDGKWLFLESVVSGQAAPKVSLANADGSRVNSLAINSKFDGSFLKDAVALPDGTWLMAGDFSNYDGQPASRFVKVDDQGVRDFSFTSPAGYENYRVNDLQMMPSQNLILVGKGPLISSFNEPQDANYLDVITLSGSLLTEDIQIQGSINSFAISGNTVLLAGGFSKIGSTKVASMARITLPQPPVNAPSGLQLTTQNLPRKITLSWTDNSADEGGFEIYRSTGNNTNFIPVAAVPANSTSYTNQTGLAGGTTYHYKVRAINLGGQTAFSNEANISTLAPVLTKAPTNLVASLLEGHKIALFWADSSDIETGFEIYRSVSVNTNYQLIHTTTANVISFTNVSLLPNTKYFYKVRAIADDPSAFTNEVNQTTMGVPPNEWSGPLTTPIGARSNGVALSINGKAYVGLGRNGTGALKDWWEYSPATDTWVKKQDFPGTARIGAIGFVVGTKCYVGTGNDFSGTGFKRDFYEYDPATNTWTAKASFPEDFSSEAGITSGVAFAIDNFGYVGLGNTGLNNTKAFFRYDPATNTWGAKADFGGVGRTDAVGFAADGKGYIGFGYGGLSSAHQDMWQYDVSANTWTQKATYSGNGRGGAAVATVMNQAYLLAGEEGSFSSSVHTSHNTRYGAAQNSWTALAGAPFSPRTAAMAFTLGTKAYVFGGVNGTTYYSDLHMFAPTSAQVPASPESAIASFVSGTELDLEWTDASQDETNFVIELSQEGGFFMAVASLPAGTTQYRQTGLTPNKNFQFRVKAINVFGASGYATSNVARTQGVPPNPPTNFRLLASTQSQVEVGWDDNSADETGFEVLKRNASAVFELISTTTANTTTYIDATTVPQVQYVYRVRAKNAFGVSAHVELTVQVPLAAPEAPTDLTAEIQPGTKVLLAWKDNSLFESGFEVYRNNELLKTVGKDEVSYTDQSFANVLEYTYKVRAANTAGTSVFTNEATITFPPNTITAVEAESASLLLEVYPNPVRGDIYIRNATERTATYSLCNSLGQLVHRGEVPSNTTSLISTAGWVKGIYLLRTHSRNQPLVKIIKE